MSITIERIVSRDALVKPESLNGYTFTGEAGAHTFVITTTRRGASEALTGTVTANFLRADNENVALGSDDCSVSSDGKAVVTLRQDCYNVPGRFLLTVYHTHSGDTEAIYSASGNVQRSKSDIYVDTGFMPTFDNLTEVATGFPAVRNAAEAATAAVETLDSRLDDAEADISTVESTVGEFGTRLTTAEGAVTSLGTTVSGLGTRLTMAEGNITGLGIRMTTAEGDITALDGKAKMAEDALAAEVSGGAAWCTDTAVNSEALGLKAQILPIWAGSGVPSESNVREMSPRTAVIVRHTDGYALEQGSLAEATGNPVASDLRLRTVDFLPVSLLGSSTVIDMAGSGRMEARARRLFFYDSSRAFLSAPSTATEALPFSFAGSSIPEGAAWFKVVFQTGSAGTATLAYDGQRLALNPVSVQMSLGTHSVYGGWVDLISGVLTVTHAMLTPVTTNINRNNASQYYVKSGAVQGIKASGTVYSSMFHPQGDGETTSTAGVCYITSTGNIRFNTAAEYATTAEMMAAHSGIAFVYELSEPQTYQLTPTEVALLAGENTVYTEDGGAELRYVRRIADAVAAIEHPDVTVSGSAPEITAQAGRCYLCGTLTSLSFTPCASGLCEVIFTSGSTPTVLSGFTGVTWPDWWTGVAPNRTYDIMVKNGALGVVTSWAN